MILLDLAAKEAEYTEFAIAVAHWVDEDRDCPILNNLMVYNDQKKRYAAGRIYYIRGNFFKEIKL